jgi:hypothetical protein
MINLPPHLFSKRLQPILSSPAPTRETFSTPSSRIQSGWRNAVASPKVPAKPKPPEKTPTSATSRKSTPGNLHMYSRNVAERTRKPPVSTAQTSIHQPAKKK